MMSRNALLAGKDTHACRSQPEQKAMLIYRKICLLDVAQNRDNAAYFTP